MALKFYFGSGSCALAGLVALEEGKADFTAIALKLAAGEQRHPDFLALNPRGQVPVLVADGQVITENLAVLTYIASRFPDARLLPFGKPAALARAYELLAWFATNLHVAVAQIWRSERFSDDPEARDALKLFGRSRFQTAIAELDRAAARGWLVGEHFSAVDPLALVAWRWAERLEIDCSPFPAWAHLVAQLKALPSVMSALAIESGDVRKVNRDVA